MQSDANATIWVDDVLTDFRPSAYAIAVFLLCVFTAMAEGYDVQALALAAPMLASAWNLSPGQVGVLLSASVIGLVVGSFLLSPLGDRWGRRPSVLSGLTIAGLGTAAGAIAPDQEWMLATRLLAGLGLGLALPNVTALAMELVPVRMRTFAVVLVSCGYPLGAGLGAGLVGSVVGEYGYVVVFVLGALVTGLALLLCGLWLPESPFVMARRGSARKGLQALLVRLGVALTPGPADFSLREKPQPHSTVAALFEPDRRTVTLLLWVVNFANMSMVYFFISWLPSLFVNRGMGQESALLGTALFSGTGMLGGILMAASLRKLGPTRVLGGSYILAGAATLAMAALPIGRELFYVMIAVCGAMVIGSQFCLMAVVNQYYPSSIRATASGYATGAGRLGAVFAPLAGGLVIGMSASAEQSFGIASVPALVALLAIASLHYRRSLPPIGRTPA